MSTRPAPEVIAGDKAIARVAAHVALATDGVARLQPGLAGRVQSLARGVADTDLAAVAVEQDGSLAGVSVQVAVALDPPPVRTVAVLTEAIRDEVTRLTGRACDVEVVVTAVE